MTLHLSYFFHDSVRYSHYIRDSLQQPTKMSLIRDSRINSGDWSKFFTMKCHKTSHHLAKQGNKKILKKLNLQSQNSLIVKYKS